MHTTEWQTAMVLKAGPASISWKCPMPSGRNVLAADRFTELQASITLDGKVIAKAYRDGLRDE